MIEQPPDWVTWFWTNWREIGAILASIGGGFAAVWAWGKLNLEGWNPFSRITRLEERLDYQDEFAQTEARIVEVERKLDQHERECLRTRRENGERLSRLEQKADHHSDKLNRIEGLIEGLKEAIRD